MASAKIALVLVCAAACAAWASADNASASVHCESAGGAGVAGNAEAFNCFIKTYSLHSNNGKGVCVQLNCANFDPAVTCGSNNDNCVNPGQISGQCATLRPIYPGSTEQFGLRTTRGAPQVSVKAVYEAEHYC